MKLAWAHVRCCRLCLFGRGKKVCPRGELYLGIPWLWLRTGGVVVGVAVEDWVGVGRGARSAAAGSSTGGGGLGKVIAAAEAIVLWLESLGRKSCLRGGAARRIARGRETTYAQARPWHWRREESGSRCADRPTCPKAKDEQAQSRLRWWQIRFKHSTWSALESMARGLCVGVRSQRRLACPCC